MAQVADARSAVAHRARRRRSERPRIHVDGRKSTSASRAVVDRARSGGLGTRVRWQRDRNLYFGVVSPRSNGRAGRARSAAAGDPRRGGHGIVVERRLLIRAAKPEDGGDARRALAPAAVGREPGGWLLNTDGWRSVAEEPALPARAEAASRRGRLSRGRRRGDRRAAVGGAGSARGKPARRRPRADGGGRPPPPRHRRALCSRRRSRGRATPVPAQARSCTSSPGNEPGGSSCTSSSASSARASARTHSPPGRVETVDAIRTASRVR